MGIGGQTKKEEKRYFFITKKANVSSTGATKPICRFPNPQLFQTKHISKMRLTNPMLVLNYLLLQ